MVGGVVDDQGGDQGAQHFGFARAGGAHDQAVGAHAPERRLLQVQQHQVPRRPDADRHPQVVAGAPRPPCLARVELGDVGHAQDLRQVDGAVQRVGAVGRGQPHRRQGARQGGEQSDARLVGGALQGSARRLGLMSHGTAATGAVGALGGVVGVLGELPVRSHVQPHVDLLGLLAPFAQQHDQVDAEVGQRGDRRLGGQAGQRRLELAVHDHDQPLRSRTRRAPAAALHVDGALLDLGRQQLRHLDGVARDQPRRERPVGDVVVRVVRQPLQPVPLGQQARVAHHAHPHVLGRGERGELGHQ
ncbi:hypothetical protein NOGI109294_19980 [Nocardiopsis gilva]